ncbi:hypothetical protein Tco_0633986 [Tanacetum coccineum]
MSTPAHFDSEIISQTVRAQSSQVPNLLPDDPYVAVRQAHFVDTDTESEPVKDLRETEAYTPATIDTESEPEEAPSETEEFEASNPSDTMITSLHSSASSDSTEPLSPDHPLTQTSPTPTLTRVSFHRRIARMAVQDTEEESSDLGTKREGSKDEGPGSEDEGHGSEDEGHGSKEEEEEEAVPKGQQQAVSAEDTAMDEPLGLDYRALRRRELVVGEAKMRSTFEVGQSSRSMLEHKGAERISAFRQPTLVTWVDPKDGRVYTDILTYVPPAAPVQTPPSLEWSSGSLYNTPCFRVIYDVNKFTMYF